MRSIKILGIIAITGMMAIPARAQQPSDPWTAQQLMQPSTLAAMIKNPQAQPPLILDVGPAGVIKGAIALGPAHEEKGMQKLKEELSSLPKATFIVIYCGCCPFSHCPNIRPAFSTLKEMGFTNAYLLNLSHNLKEDWINKGYPLEKQ